MKRRFNLVDGIDRADFASLGELVDVVLNGKVIDANVECHRNTLESPREWNNHFDAKRVVRELNNPPACHDKVEKIKSRIDGHFEGPKTIRRLVNRREDGDELDAGAWVRRELDGWSAMERRAEPRRVIRIACNVAINFRRTAEELYYRGAAAAALADALESDGHSVEVDMFDTFKGGITSKGQRLQYVKTTIKRADMPMDLETMSLALSEIGFVRTVVMGSLSALADGKVSPSYGTPTNIPENEAAQYDVVFDDDILDLESAVNVVKHYAGQFKTGGD